MHVIAYFLSVCFSKQNCFPCSNPGSPFSSGVTLAKLAAVTMDEQGNETFDASGALDKLRKVRLAFFLCEVSFTKIVK